MIVKLRRKKLSEQTMNFLAPKFKTEEPCTMGLVLCCLNSSLIGFVFLVIFTILFLIQRSKVVRCRIQPPLAAGAWPIIGHLWQLSGSQMPQLTLGAMADKHGPLFTIRLGSQRALVISNWKVAKECFTTNDLAISSRPRVIAVQKMTYNQAMFAFAPHGLYWRELRKFSTLELLSNHRIELLSPVRVSEVETSIKELFKLWVEKKDELGRVKVEMRQWFCELTLNAVVRMVVGKRCFGVTGEDEEMSRLCLKGMRNFFRLNGLFLMGDAIPCLRWLDLGGHEKAMEKTANELDSILGEWLEEHRQKRASGVVAEDQDFMDVMLSYLDTTNFEGYDEDTIHKATTLILIAAGVDTTASTLIWTICHLLNNPATLKEAQKELDIQIGKEQPVKESDIDKLVYIQAIVKETLRLNPPAPFSGPREFTKDCTIDGYHITKGTRLITNLWKIHTDPNVWSDPLEFKPERFLTTYKDFDIRGNHFELMPFGSGRRKCPGISFALRMVHLVLASFLQSFEISKPSDEPIDMSESFGLITMKATPLDVLINPRVSSRLYDSV